MAIVLGMMSKKGGAGKSTITKLLASAIVFSGHKCLVIDLDENEDIFRWWTRVSDRGNHDKRFAVRVAQSDSEELYNLVDQNEDNYDFILIDTKGEGARWHDDLASVADRLILPCLNTESDADRTRETIQWYEALKTRVEDPASVPPMHVVMNRLPSSIFGYDGKRVPSGMTADDLGYFKELVREFKPLKTIVPDRRQYIKMDKVGLLGTLLDQARNGEWKDQGQALHIESALAHATDLMNSILTGSTMEAFDGS